MSSSCHQAAGQPYERLIHSQNHPNLNDQHHHLKRNHQEYHHSGARPQSAGDAARQLLFEPATPLAEDQLVLNTTTLFCLLIVFLLFKYKRQQKELHNARLADKLERLNLKRMPAPPSLPLIGHIHLMRDHQNNPWEGFNAIRKQWGDLVSLKMGVHQMVLISSVDHMNEVLIKKGHIFADRPSFPRHDIVFGGDKEHSLALCNWSNTHRARRKFCKRGVVPNKLSARNRLLENVISEIVSKFMDDILRIDDNNRNNGSDEATTETGGARQAQSGEQRPDLSGPPVVYRVNKRDLLFLTGDIFMKFLCSESRPRSDKAYEEFNLGCDFIFYDINQCYLLDFMPYLTSFGLGYSYLKQVRGVTDYCRNYIDENIFEPRRLRISRESRSRASSGNNLATISATSATPHGPRSSAAERNQTPSGKSVVLNGDESADDDYLDSIIREQLDGASLMSLEDYKVGFADLLAGHAAVTNILMRLLGHLALDLETQELICEEAKRTKLTSLSETPPLPVTEAALQEALRLASSPIVPHVAREDSSIGQFFVPKGSAVLFNCYNVNLSPELWDEPREFRPARFLRSSRNQAGEMSYKLELPKYFMPFSVGQRQCLGYKMVESISIVAVAHMCASFRIRANDEELVGRLLEPKGTVALSPLEECFELILMPRDNLHRHARMTHEFNL